jgi:archaellum component FlaC
MSTISTNDDATPMVQGTADMIDAALGVVEGVIAPQQKQKQPAQGQERPSKNDDTKIVSTPDSHKSPSDSIKNQNLVQAILDKIPKEDRDKVTIRVGATNVHAPGKNIRINNTQAGILRNVLDDPSRVSGVFKIISKDGSPKVLISKGDVSKDDYGLIPETLKQKLQPDLPSDALKTEPVESSKPETTIESVKQDPPLELAKPDGLKDPVSEVAEKLSGEPDAIARLEKTIEGLTERISTLEASMSQKPAQLGNEKVGNWFNKQRNNIANAIHNRADSFSDRLKMAVTQKVDSIKENINQRVDKLTDRVHVAANKIGTQVNEFRDATADKIDAAGEKVEKAIDVVKDGVETVKDGLGTVKVAVTNAAQDAIDAGMDRHNAAMEGVNKTAATVTADLKQTIDNPWQKLMETTAPAVELVMNRLEQAKDSRIQKDADGTRSLQVGDRQFQLSSSGNLSVHTPEGKITAQNATKNDISETWGMKCLADRMEESKQSIKIEAPIPKVGEGVKPLSSKLVMPPPKVKVGAP